MAAGEGRRHRKAIGVFEELLDLDRLQQQSRLSRLERDQPELAAMVRRLIDRDRQDSELEKKPLVFPDLGRESIFGPYRLQALIGQGGMSRVYRAFRLDNQPSFPIAVKVMPRWGNQTDRTELDIHGELEHRYIARMLDAGSTEHFAWTAMELVDGRDIKVYVENRAGPPKAVLEIFLKVLEAIAYAHARLVVHLDLKPSNILITTQADPKILDFGISRRLGGGGTTASKNLLTLRYASPEQIRGQSVGTSSDIYSLGLVLFELLAGRHLIDESLTSRDAILAWHRRFSASTMGAMATLDRDLSAILQRALEPDPSMRYPTPDQMAGDIRRYLAGYPVASAAPRWWVFWKALRRNRWVASIIFLLMTGTALLSWQAWTIDRQRSLAERERERAQMAMNIFVDSLSDFGRAQRDPELKAADLLRGAIDRVQHETRGDPALQAILLTRLGRLYHAIGDASAAVKLLEQAGSMAENQHERLRIQDALARACISAGQYERAVDLARETYDRLRIDQVEGVDLERSATQTLARALFRDSRNEMARLEQALEVADRSVDLAAGSLEPMATALGLRANIWMHLGHLDRAARDARRALALSDRLNDPLSKADALNNLALIEDNTGLVDSAIGHFQQALALIRAELGAHPDVAGALNNLGMVYARVGDVHRAESRFCEAIELYRDLRGDRDFMTANCRANLAHLLQWNGRAGEAEHHYLWLEDFFYQELESGHPFQPFITSLLAECLASQGRMEQAGAKLESVRERNTDGWMEVTIAGIEASVAGITRREPAITRGLWRSWQQLIDLRGHQAQPTLDARSRWQAYCRRWGLDPEHIHEGAQLP